MKKITLYGILFILLLSLVGSGCSRNVQTGPENPRFIVVTDDPIARNALGYFQANTGYLPDVVLIDDEAMQATAAELTENGKSAERADVLRAMSEDATCLLLGDAALIAEFEALGFAVDNEALKTLSVNYRIENAEQLGWTLVQMPTGSETNIDALRTLAAWLTGAEAKHLSENPELLK